MAIVLATGLAVAGCGTGQFQASGCAGGVLGVVTGGGGGEAGTELYAVLEGGKTRRLTSLGTAQSPAVDSAGSRVYFVSAAPGRSNGGDNSAEATDLHRLPTASTSSEVLTHGAWLDRVSVGRSTVVFGSEAPPSVERPPTRPVLDLPPVVTDWRSPVSTEQTTTRLYLLRDGESTPIRVTDEPAKSWTAELESAVSPDDSNVAYVAATYRANAVGFRQDIRVAPLVGGAPGRVVYEVPAAKFVDSLDWSPDGDRLLLLLIDDGGQGAEVVEVDATTGRQARVLPQNRSASGARYLGGSIAVLEREEGRDSTLVVLRGDGETSRQRLDVENPHQFDAGSCEEVA